MLLESGGSLLRLVRCASDPSTSPFKWPNLRLIHNEHFRAYAILGEVYSTPFSTHTVAL